VEFGFLIIGPQHSEPGAYIDRHGRQDDKNSPRAHPALSRVSLGEPWGRLTLGSPWSMPQTNLDTTFQLVLSLAFQILMDLPSIINPRFNLNPQAVLLFL
jgi:hypothetical protein